MKLTNNQNSSKKDMHKRWDILSAEDKMRLIRKEKQKNVLIGEKVFMK
jgi:hypothetical protein